VLIRAKEGVFPFTVTFFFWHRQTFTTNMARTKQQKPSKLVPVQTRYRPSETTRKNLRTYIKPQGMFRTMAFKRVVRDATKQHGFRIQPAAVRLLSKACEDFIKHNQ